MSPKEVTIKNQQQVYNYQYEDIESIENFIEFKYKIGDYVRIKIEKKFI